MRYRGLIVNNFGDVIGRECNTCNELKLFSEYHKSPSGKYGYIQKCSSCVREYDKQRRESYREKRKLLSKQWREANKDTLIEKRKEYYNSNKEHILKKNEEYRQANKDKVNETTRLRNLKRRYNDPIYKLRRAMPAHIRRCLESKNKGTCEVIGCSYLDLWNHLCSTFEENYGMPREWLSSFDYHIDHIIPLSSAKSLEEVIKLNHYTNLQILTKEDNLNKSNKLDWTIEENSII